MPTNAVTSEPRVFANRSKGADPCPSAALALSDDDAKHPRLRAWDDEASSSFTTSSSARPRSSRSSDDSFGGSAVVGGAVTGALVGARVGAQVGASPPPPAPQPNPEPWGRAPSGAVRMSPNDLGVIPQGQGNTNACGTTSLANVMTHFGSPTTHDDLDKGIRAFNLFTAPDRIVHAARANGFRAELKSEASLDDITHLIDHGVPPIVLYDPDGRDNATLHYATITGYNRGPDGRVSEVIIANSAGDGHRHAMPAGEFLDRWSDLHMKDVDTGMSRVLVSVVPNSDRIVVGGDGRRRNASSIDLPTPSFFADMRSSVARLGATIFTTGAVGARRLRDGAEWAGDRAVEGARWTGDRVVEGAQWTRDRAVEGAQWAGGQLVGGAQRVERGANALGNAAGRVWRSIFD